MTRLLSLTKGKFALVDDCFYPVLTAMGKWHWTSSGYAVLYTRDSSGKRRARYLHRVVQELVLGHPVGRLQVDHRNADRLDARAENLRNATAAENQAAKKSQKNSASGHKGVTLRRGKFDVRLRYYHHRLSVGRYTDFGLAVLAYRYCHQKLWRDFSSSGQGDIPLPAAIKAKLDKQIATLLKEVSLE